MPKQTISAGMKKALQAVLEEDEPPQKNNRTLKSLEDRYLLNQDGSLTSTGWKLAISTLPLDRQCHYLGVRFENLNGVEYSGKPEPAVLRHFNQQGYIGASCEGGPILLLIRAAALDVFAELNTFGSRADACTRFTEAQLKIHEDYESEILAAIEASKAANTIHNFKEIYDHEFVRQTYPGLTSQIIESLYNAIGVTNLVAITHAIMEDPYTYRSGWPDLTMVRGMEVLWIEVKTTDKLHISQITTLHKMLPTLPGSVRVLKLSR